MKKVLLAFTACWLLVTCSSAQTITQKLQQAFGSFEADSQLTNAISSLYVIDAATGQVVFDKFSRIGLAPASTQKIITSVTAFELLGKDYKYKTEISYDGEIKNGVLHGNIYLQGSGDPTFGSWRFASTKGADLTNVFTNALKKKGISHHRGSIIAVKGNFDNSRIPDGWIWQDIGNYYGASAGSLNWNENQYDLIMKPGLKPGDPIKIIGTAPKISNQFINEVVSGSKGSGDNAYIYFDPATSYYYVNGTIPCCIDSFKISGSATNSNLFTLNQFANILTEQFLEERTSFHLRLDDSIGNKPITNLHTHYSPALDSIIYWFNKKSINLYGEALVKTFAYEKQGFGSTDSGVAILRNFWKEKGLDKNELNMADGSGLSPLNRVTTHAQVEILKYAKTKDWFPYFFDALPEYNGMKMKSGTISDVKAFCGYHKSKDGKEYIFSFIVNNYNGRASQLVKKMYKVLDVLK